MPGTRTMPARTMQDRSRGSVTAQKQSALRRLVPPAQIAKNTRAPSKTTEDGTSSESDEESDMNESGKEGEKIAAEESSDSDSGEDSESSDDQSDDSDDSDDSESEEQTTYEAIPGEVNSSMKAKNFTKEESEEEDEGSQSAEQQIFSEAISREVISGIKTRQSGNEETESEEGGEEEEEEDTGNGDNSAEAPNGKTPEVSEDVVEDGSSSSDDSIEDIPGVLPPHLQAEFPPEYSEDEEEEGKEGEKGTENAAEMDAYAIPHGEYEEDEYAVPESPVLRKRLTPSERPVAVKRSSHKWVPKKSILERQSGELGEAPGEAPDETPEDIVQAEKLACTSAAPLAEEERATASPTRVQTARRIPATPTAEITKATETTQTLQALQKLQRTQKTILRNTQPIGTPQRPASGSSKVFSTEEIAHIEEAAATFRDEKNITRQEFNEMVQDSAIKHKELWSVLIDACEPKPRKSVILRCRRMFHNFKEMYRWTPEEDDELAVLVAEHGHKWVVISGLLNRHREDVRKRWEERVVCRDDGRLFAWTFEEEKRLAEVVGEMVRIIKESREKAVNGKTATSTSIDPQTVADISWSQVSERMGHTRTARQCRVKWVDVQETYQFNEAGGVVGPPVPKELTPSQKRAVTMSTRDWKTRGGRAKLVDGDEPFVRDADEDGERVPETSRRISDKVRRQIRRMGSAEKYRLIASIRDSDVLREKKIPWTRLVDETFRSQWRRPTRELVWSRLKRTVPDFHNKTVRQIAQHLMDEYEQHKQLGNGWEFDYGGEEDAGDEAEEHPQKKKRHSKTGKTDKAERKGRKGKPQKAYKSSNIAVDEDEEEEERMSKDMELEATLSRRRLSKRGKEDVPESDNEAKNRRRSRRVDKPPSKRMVMEEEEEVQEEVQETQGSKHRRRDSIDLGVDAMTATTDLRLKRKKVLANGMTAKKRRIG